LRGHITQTNKTMIVVIRMRAALKCGNRVLTLCIFSTKLDLRESKPKRFWVWFSQFFHSLYNTIIISGLTYKHGNLETLKIHRKQII